MRIIFLGTPDFAVASLQILVENNYQIVGVVTAPDKPAGRGKQLQISEVKKYALSKNLRLLQPEKLKNEDFLEELASLKADLQIVVAFRMLPELVWAMPPLGTFNLHASLLPKYRGAAPINWAIINGESETGLTTFFLQHEIDTGNVIFQEKESISINDTAGDLYERLMLKGAKLVLKTVQAIEKGNITTQMQTGEITHAPKIFRETCQIDWHKNSDEIHNFVRGLAPYPTAWTSLQGKNCKIFAVTPSKTITKIANVGDWCIEDQKLAFRSKDTWIEILDLQLEGKKRMFVSEFLKGFRL
ncbi:MAG: methionyl-tRNA formyltransferase [Thermonemataceae bacterium]|nr:methionyl-tRNA formyltransferase [Thermonemataceae bacterium]